MILACVFPDICYGSFHFLKDQTITIGDSTIPEAIPNFKGKHEYSQLTIRMNDNLRRLMRHFYLQAARPMDVILRCEDISLTEILIPHRSFPLPVCTVSHNNFLIPAAEQIAD